MLLSDLSIRRPVFATVVNLVVLLIGVIAYQRLVVRLIPNVDVPVVNVSTTYPGANARVIESQITQPIEDALSGVEGIDFIQSTSREQSSQVTVRFRIDRDADAAASDVRDRVSRARQFLPEEANEPIVQKQEADAQPIIYLAFSSDRHEQVEIADIAERLVKDRVQTIPGVAQAQVFASTYAMRIWLDPQRLAGFKLTPADVEAALRKQNVEIPAGRVESADREFTVLSETDLRTAEDFGAVIIGGVEGYLVRLRDVARVELGAEENRFRARYNGRTAVPLAIVKQAVANPLEIASALKKMIPQIQRTLPEGMKVEIAYDTTVFIEKSIEEVYSTIGIALLLVVLVIFAFILMTTGAMVLGSLPLAIATGAGAEARNQIGRVIVGGMAIGTLFTLLVVPVVYLLIARKRKHAHNAATVGQVAAAT